MINLKTVLSRRIDLKLAIFCIYGILSQGCFSNSWISQKQANSIVPDTPFVPVPPKVVSKIFVGRHSCVTYDSGMDCWGPNDAGQIGALGALNPTLAPVEVLAMAGVSKISTGVSHSCYLYNGAVKCVGIGTGGQLGDGASSTSATFVDVTGLGVGVTDISSGANTTCAVKLGGLYCWGIGTNYQIGDNNSVNRNSPVEIFAIGSQVTAVSVGDRHACAIVDSELWCWGRNDYGQIGDGTNSDRQVPTKILSLGSGITSVDLGENHTCAVKNAGLYCWGRNQYGQIGDNSLVNRNAPVNIIAEGSQVAKPALGNSHSCAVVGSEVYCWGSNLVGQMNDTVSAANKLVPTLVFDSSQAVTDLDAGPSHSCIVQNNSKIFCWGSGELGSGGSGDSLIWPSPTLVTGIASGLEKIAKVKVVNDDGSFQNCAIQNGGVKCWGTDLNGSLGNGGADVSLNTPSQVFPDLSGVTDLSIISGTYDSTGCALINGGVQCWGGVYGNGPLQIIAPASSVTSIRLSHYGSANASWGCAAVSAGLRCWGTNALGQLGNGTTVNSLTTPVIAIADGSGVTDFDTSNGITCAVRSGGLDCWGLNFYGQVGDGTGVNRSSPTQIFPPGSDVTQVAIVGLTWNPFFSTVCAVINSGLSCWGYNGGGTVGDGTTTNRLSPVIIFPPGSGVTKVWGRESSLCVIKNGGLFCWGNNAEGSLGVGDLVSRAVPTQVFPEGTGVTDFDISPYNGCAIISGGLKCWGRNAEGTVGNGSIVRQLNPVEIWPAGSNVQEISQVYESVFCAHVSGAMKCWGSDANSFGSYGVLGNGQVNRGVVPVSGYGP